MTFLSEATSAPASVIATLFNDAIRGISNVGTLISRYRAYAKAEGELLRLSDHELDDLGIRRTEIRDRVWANFDK